ncbi:MAG: hydroxymethylbilane synthase [Rhodospirillales bacterium]
MATPFVLRIGTRGSPLALTQARMVRAALAAAHPALRARGALEEVVVKTTGDKVLDRPLAELGGKGLFTKEIDEALLYGRIDCAVHSLKDVPTWLPEGLMLACYPEREDPRDALVCRTAATLAALPPGSVVGTASLRRRAQILYRRPDLDVVPFRGNVETRLAKLDAGEADATLLALAGLKRLGKTEAAAVIEPDEILPAVGQGAIGIMCRTGDARVRDYLAALDDPVTAACVRAERAMLAVLDGSCRTPIGGLAEIDGDVLTVRGLIAKPDGSALIAARKSGPRDDPESVGRAVGAALLADADPDFLAGLG